MCKLHIISYTCGCDSEIVQTDPCDKPSDLSRESPECKMEFEFFGFCQHCRARLDFQAKERRCSEKAVGAQRLKVFSFKKRKTTATKVEGDIPCCDSFLREMGYHSPICEEMSDEAL